MKQITKIFQILLGVVALIFTFLIAVGRWAWRKIGKCGTKKVRKAVGVTIILIVAGIAGVIGYVVYDDMFGRDYYDRELSENVVLRSFADNKWKVYNKLTQSYTTDRIDWLSEDEHEDSLAVYAQNNRRGFINVYTGEIVINANDNNYSRAWVFNEGLAAVVKDEKIGFIDSRNRVVIPFNYDYTIDHDMPDMAYVFHAGYCAVPNADGMIGLIDKSGNWALEPIYDEVWIPKDNGYRVVILDGKYGLLNSDLKLVYEPVYEFISNYAESDRFVLMKDGRMWQEDTNGNVVVPFMYESIENLNYAYDVDEEGDALYIMSHYSMYLIAQRYGILDRNTGEPITLAIYDYVKMISPNVFQVTPSDSYGKYLIDTEGNIVEP